ncbi:unnamed protein product [Nyctereutes procyonoides]|uniref:(raccoon dog) hypothetical protein n=1 Tax=Nyctereutes procyonoides TaxID=34880 RepID=A0A811ZWK8_NYCPR|nr:unnamed protein product [Nyctereutes procyonoides]
MLSPRITKFQPRFSVGTATATHTHTHAHAHSRPRGSATQPSPSRGRGAARQADPGDAARLQGDQGRAPAASAKSADSTAREFGGFTMGPPAWPPGPSRKLRAEGNSNSDSHGIHHFGILTLDLFHSHGEALPGPSFSSLRSSASPLPNELANSGKTIYTTLLCPKGLTGQMETTSSISYQTTKLKEMTSDDTRTQELGSGG